MHRRTQRPAIDSGPVRPNGVAALELLLRARAIKHRDTAAPEKGRRDLHREAILRIQEDHASIAEGGLPRQSEEGAGHYARIGACRDPAWPSHLEEPSRAHQVSLPPSGSRGPQASTGMEHRHHLHSIASWLCVPCGIHRLVQSPGALIPTVQQPGHHILPGGIRVGYSKVWSSRDSQYRSRSPVHITGICRCRTGVRYSLQHGWSRKGTRQRLRRATMALCEIRRGLPQ